MGRRAARALHLGLSALGALLFFLFVIPRWWVLTGDLPASLGTTGRIAAGLPIAAAAVPVMATLRRSLDAGTGQTPELALRLRAWSAVLHPVAGGLILVAALAEIWLSGEAAGPWLYAVYGAAAAIAVLAVLAFALSFVAEKPPAPPKAPKAARETAERAAESGEPDARTQKQKIQKAQRRLRRSGKASEVAEPTVATGPVGEAEQHGEAEPAGGLRNKRPAGKSRDRLPG